MLQAASILTSLHQTQKPQWRKHMDDFPNRTTPMVSRPFQLQYFNTGRPRLTNTQHLRQKAHGYLIMLHSHDFCLKTMHIYIFNTMSNAWNQWRLFFLSLSLILKTSTLPCHSFRKDGVSTEGPSFPGPSAGLCQHGQGGASPGLLIVGGFCSLRLRFLDGRGLLVLDCWVA